MNLKSVIQAAEQIAKDKGIDVAKVYEAIEGALAAAYKKEEGDKGAIIRAKLDPKTGDVTFTRIKEVVDETTVNMAEGAEEEEAIAAVAAEEGEEPRLPRFNPERHLLLDEAKQVKPDAKVGDELEFPLPPSSEFGRIATQAAKQRIIQMLRQAERESVISEYKGKEGQIISGIVQRFDRGSVNVDLGRAQAMMPRGETVSGEHYTVGERMRFYILAVSDDPKSRVPNILLSRNNPNFVVKLFESEVPEIADGTVAVKVIAREAGSRTKIAVASNAPGIDAVGSCVGQRGTRVMTVTNELGSEKIDIVQWSEKADELIANALAPADVKAVELLSDREARVMVQDDQLSLAIGKGGQNVRLAAKLTGWKIDVRPLSKPNEVQEGGVAAAVDLENEEHPEGDPAGNSTVEGGVRPIYHKEDDDD